MATVSATAGMAIAAAVQAVSAVFVAWLTHRLVLTINKHEQTTERLLRLNQEQFERGWRPDLPQAL